MVLAQRLRWLGGQMRSLRNSIRKMGRHITMHSSFSMRSRRAIWSPLSRYARKRSLLAEVDSGLTHKRIIIHKPDCRHSVDSFREGSHQLWRDWHGHRRRETTSAAYSDSLRNSLSTWTSKFTRTMMPLCSRQPRLSAKWRTSQTRNWQRPCLFSLSTSSATVQHPNLLHWKSWTRYLLFHGTPLHG